MWVAAAVVTGGLAIPLYFLAWIILPRDDRPPVTGPQQWRDWSQEFHAETQRLAEEARRVAGEVREASQTWRDQPAETEPSTTSSTAATDKGTPTAYAEPAGTSAYTSEPAPQPWSSTPPTAEPWTPMSSDVEPHRGHRGPPRTAGVVLVGIGILLLAGNAGVFSWIQWGTMWPLILIGLGVILLAKQQNWGG
jgi:hypothetical protein